MSRRLQALQFRAEAALARGAIAVLRRLRPVAASNLAGALGRMVGPLLPVSRVADINLRHAMPELDAAARRGVIRGAWDSLGRTVAELPHVGSLQRTDAGPGWEIIGEDIVRDLVARGGPLIWVSAHLSNWEVLPRGAAAYGAAFASFYRTAKNPIVDSIITELRTAAIGADLPRFAKGASGARAALAYLGKGGRVAMLVDQKMNEGIEARLFGQPAMTATAPAAFALRYRCPLIPAHVERLGPARFRLVVEPPLSLPDSGDRQADIAAVTQAINDCLERWIRARPEAWLWLHRRFPTGVYRR